MSSAAVAVGGPRTEPAPDVADDQLPEVLTAPYPATDAPPPRARRTPWTRRRLPRALPAAAVVFMAVLLVYAVATGSGDGADEISVTDRPPSTTEATVSTTAAPTTAPVPTTVAAPVPTTLAPPPTTGAAPPPATAPPARPAARAGRAPTPRPSRPAPAPAPVVTSFPRMCGFAPGSPVDVELNGRPAGTQTADGNGCVSRPPGGR
ncbi:MAG TPA: hypothetical protein VHG90_09755 [Acidimicrobiales bacterium]|nr:hypothetical protein [Acidimicrobiales bacterium]